MILKGAVSMVTGAASGLGRATVERLLGSGARVAMLDLPTSQGKQLADELGDRVLFVPADVRSEDDVSEALESIKTKWGSLNHLINCAGISSAFVTYSVNKGTPMHLDTFTETVLVNAVGTFNVCRLAVHLMEKNSPDPGGQRGVIINVSSTAAFEGQCSQTAFAASKAAISSMTLPMSRDLASLGIRVMCIAPGHFDTPLINSQMSEKVQQFLTTFQTFPKRLGKSEEFADLALHIINNPLLNGEIIRLDGGLRMHGIL